MQYNLSTHMQPSYRTRSLDTLLRMGHCAPAIMQTVLATTHNEQEWLVRLMAGMPGGIGNTGFECGGITSPLVLLGLRNGLLFVCAGLFLVLVSVIGYLSPRLRQVEGELPGKAPEKVAVVKSRGLVTASQASIAS